MRFGFDNGSFYRGAISGLGVGILTQLLSYFLLKQQLGSPDPLWALILHAIIYAALGWWGCSKVRTVEDGYIVGGSFGIGMAVGWWIPFVGATFIVAPGYLTLRTAGLFIPVALFTEIKYALIPLMVGRWRGMRHDQPSNTMDRQ